MKSIAPADMALVQNAKEAAYLEGKLRPFFDEIEHEQIEKLKMHFKGDILNDADLRVGVGILCSIDEFKQKLFQQINKGKSIERKLHE